MVAVADELTNAGCRHLGVFLRKIHRHLAHKDILALATATEHVLLGDIEMTAHLVENVVDGERMVVHLHCTLDDSLCQVHVDITIIYHGICQERINHSLKVAHTAACRLGDISDYILGNLQSVATALVLEDIHAQLHIGLLHLGNQSARESREQTIFHSLKIDRRTVAGKDYLLAVAEEMIEDMEEGVEGAGGCGPLLDIIHDEHIDALIEIDEVVDSFLQLGVGELHLEETGADIEHSLLGIEFLASHADGIDEVGFAASRGTVHIEGVEC